MENSKKVSMKNRSISDEFLNEIKNGSLKPLYDYVLKDDTLCLELRGDSINIYYRGGSLFRITDKYEITFDTNYCTEDKCLDPKPDIQEAVKNIPFYKQAMDFWFSKKPKQEREFQQVILRENNNSGKISRGTDYYILDIEYVPGDARFDMVALKWQSNGAVRKKTKNLSLALIEVKYGDNALDGTSGIEKHLHDFEVFCNNSDKYNAFIKDMEKVYNQKHKLALLDGLDGKNQSEILISGEKPEIIFVFANHDPDSTKLNGILKKVDEDKYGFNIFIASSSEMGYGLYRDKFKSIKEFLG